MDDEKNIPILTYDKATSSGYSVVSKSASNERTSGDLSDLQSNNCDIVMKNPVSHAMEHELTYGLEHNIDKLLQLTEESETSFQRFLKQG